MWYTIDPPTYNIKEPVSITYLVTTDKGAVDVADWTNKNRVDPDYIGNWHWVTNKTFDNVVAWMELPQPYVKE